MRSILCFGDSITFGMGEDGGWVGRLKKYFESLGEHHGVYNLGIPGNSSSELLKRFDTEAKSRISYIWPDDQYLIVISIGMNDARGIGKLSEFQTKPVQFEKNILELIKKSKKHTKEIAFVSITPVDEKLVSPYEDDYYSNKSIERYNKILQKACEKNKVLYINVFDSLLKKGHEKLLYDGLHPNSEGYEEIFKVIKNKLSYWLK